MTKEDAYIFLWSISGIGNKTISNIDRYLNGDIEYFKDIDDEQLKKLIKSKKAYDELKKIKNSKLYMDDLYEEYDKNSIKIITISSALYPKYLKEIYNKPYVLTYRGNANLLNNFSIAIVGSRKASNYGFECAKKFAKELSEKEITVISGLALGIDSVSHRNSYNECGRTIAVLGSALDYIYPKQNKILFDEIIKNDGLVISEYPLYTPPVKGNFPMRNRIISGISRGVLVVEASKRSGSLITADFALEQGRNVYAIPSSIYSKMGIGTNNLIKQGAKLVSNIDDILQDFEMEFDILKKHGIYNNEEKNNFNDLSKIEKRLVEIIENSGEIDIEMLSLKSNIPIKDVIGVLNILEIKGIVLELRNKIYSLNL
ncbi:DNA-processing protein DprA [Peptostreptococcaceae bacterium AGR-M142]